MDHRNTDRYDAALLEAADVLRPLLERPEVARGWTSPSALPQLSVGALACHVGRQIVRAAELLPAPTELPTLATVDEHYRNAPWTTATSLDDPANDRSDDDADAALGVDALLTRFASARTEVARLIADERAQPIVAVPWQGWSLRRDDFVLTRLLEIVVHADDLATSVDVATPEFPADVFDPVAALLLRLSVRRHGQGPVVATLSRRERAEPISAF